MSRNPAPRRLRGRFLRAARRKDSVALRKLWREHPGYDWNEFARELSSDAKEWVSYEWRDAKIA